MDQTNLYVTTQGTVIGCSHNRFVLKKKKKKFFEMPAQAVQQIVIFGNAMITTQAVHMILERGIDVAYLSSRGRYRGRLEAELAGNGILRKRQTQAFLSNETRVRLAEAIVWAKIHNGLKLCLRKKGALDARLKSGLEGLLKKARDAQNLQELRGCEGRAAFLHFKALRAMLSDSMGFRCRSARPPTDPVNVLLSLGYTILYNNVRSAINIVGLDPYQGFYHAIAHGHAALASDLMEPFRSIIVDSVCLHALNSGLIGKKDFRKTTEGIRLRDQGLERFVGLYDKRIGTKIRYPGKNEQVTYQRCLEYQARDLANAILGTSPFTPFSVRG